MTIAPGASVLVAAGRTPSLDPTSFVAAGALLLDTLWVTWALHTLGGMGGDFFLLYVIVLVLAGVGERPALVTFGAAIASCATLWELWSGSPWTTGVLLRVVFLFTMSLFYGHVVARIRRTTITRVISGQSATASSTTCFTLTGLPRLGNESQVNRAFALTSRSRDEMADDPYPEKSGTAIPPMRLIASSAITVSGTIGR